MRIYWRKPSHSTNEIHKEKQIMVEIPVQSFTAGLYTRHAWLMQRNEKPHMYANCINGHLRIWLPWSFIRSQQQFPNWESRWLGSYGTVFQEVQLRNLPRVLVNRRQSTSRLVEDIPSIYCKLRLTKKFYTMFAQTACENLFTLRAKCFISNTVIFNDLQWPGTTVSWSQYFTAVNISKTLRANLLQNI